MLVAKPVSQTDRQYIEVVSQVESFGFGPRVVHNRLRVSGGTMANLIFLRETLETILEV